MSSATLASSAKWVNARMTGMALLDLDTVEQLRQVGAVDLGPAHPERLDPGPLDQVEDLVAVLLAHRVAENGAQQPDVLAHRFGGLPAHLGALDSADRVQCGFGHQVGRFSHVFKYRRSGRSPHGEAQRSDASAASNSVRNRSASAARNAIGGRILSTLPCGPDAEISTRRRRNSLTTRARAVGIGAVLGAGDHLDADEQPVATDLRDPVQAGGDRVDARLELRPDLGGVAR